MSDLLIKGEMIDFSVINCKVCPIRKECKECEITDLTCEELYKVINESNVEASNDCD